jgi:RNA polymerase I specific transcription initiation factor RRN3
MIFLAFKDASLRILVQQVNKSISLLIPKVESFVDELLDVKWTDSSPEVIEEYVGFLQSLVSAHNYYCKSVVRMLVSYFTLGPEANVALSYIHEILKGIMDIVPL